MYSVEIFRVAFASLWLLLFGVSEPESKAESATFPPKSVEHPSRVILITVDTLRQDRLECYGYHRSKTPNFNRLATDGVRFTNAIAQVPLTLPSHCSILTGTYPVFHGVHDQTGNLSEKQTTLAKLLQAQGFSTAAFVSAFVLNSRFGLNQGFDLYDDISARRRGASSDEIERRGDQTLSRAKVWMEKLGNRNFFVWLHFYDPHAPYAPPEPYKTRYAGRPYDGEIAFVDSLIGELIQFLKGKGWYSQTSVVVAADHGEDLGDHGEHTHGFFVYDSTVRIPLIVKPPTQKFAGKVVGEPVQSVDIAPTILQLLARPASQEMQGRGLLSLMMQENRQPGIGLGETYYPFHHFGWSPLRFLRTKKFKYIESPKPELYDLEVDPRETTNLISAQRTIATELRRQLFEALGRFARRDTVSGPVQQVDIATLEKLRSLGYVGYSLHRETSETADYHELSDPKERLGVYTRYQGALQDEENNRIQEAIQKYGELVEADPHLIDAQIHLGLCYKRQGQYAKAIEQFKRAALLAPESTIVTYNLAHSYALAGKIDEALAGFNRTLQLDPRESRAHLGLGIAHQLRGELDQAVAEYQRTLEMNPSDSTALSNLGATFLAKGGTDKALPYLKQAVEIDPNNVEACNTLGSAFLIKNNFDEAMANFRRALELNSNYTQAHLNLALALMKTGNAQEAVTSLKRALEISPSSAYAHQLLGEAYVAQGMRQAADAEFQAAKKLGYR